MTTERKAQLMQHEVTLDGLPAVITGRLEKFAFVRSTIDINISAEYAWETVENVIENYGGKFKS